jgi:hypothetical protein
MPRASTSIGAAAKELTASTRNKTSGKPRSTAAIDGRSWSTPVAVSEWVTHTASKLPPARAVSRASARTAWPSGASTNTVALPFICAISFQRSLKAPQTVCSERPGTRLLIAASSSAVAEPVQRIGMARVPA